MSKNFCPPKYMYTGIVATGIDIREYTECGLCFAMYTY